MTSLQDIKNLIAWAGPHSGLPPSSAIPPILGLLDSAPACQETVFYALHNYLTAALSKLFQGAAPNKQHFAQRFTGGAGKEREREGDANSINEDVRGISAHLLSVLQKNSQQWAPIITKWTIDILSTAEPTTPRSVSTALENIPILETLLAVRLKYPSLKNLSSLLSSSWLFLDLPTCTHVLDELIVGGAGIEGEKGKKAGGTEIDWVLALIGMHDPERTILISLRHLATYYTLGRQQNTAQQLVLHRAGKLAEFIAFRYPVIASSAVLLFLDDNLFPPSHNQVLRSLEEKIGFLANAGSAFPKLFDAAFGAVLEKMEAVADFAPVLPPIVHTHTRTLLENLLSERLHNIATSSYLPRIFSALHAISNHPTQGMETDAGIPLHTLAHSLLSHILDKICELSFNSNNRANEPILWGVVGQWRIFWDFGEIGQASVLAALSGLDRSSQSATARNVHAVAGAALAHALVKTEPHSASKSGQNSLSSLITVLTVFDSQPTLLTRAMDCVMEQIAPNPQLSCVLLSRFDSFIPLANRTPAFATLAKNVSMHWQKILTFTNHPHPPLRIAALQLLRSILPILYAQLPSHHSPPQQNQPIHSYPASHIFLPKSILKLKIDAIALQTIIRTLTKTLLGDLKSENLDFEYLESIMNTIAVAASLSPTHFGLVVTLLLEFIFSNQATNIIREPISTPLQPTNCLPRPNQLGDDDKEKKRLLDMNYTRHWRAQLHNRLGSGVFIPKRQRLADSNNPRGFSTISVRDNNIHNDFEETVKLNGHVSVDPDLELYGNDGLALRRSALSSLLGRCIANKPTSYFATLTDQYLVQLATQAPVPTYEQYAEILPKLSPFERDVFLRKVFKQNPILLDILELIADEPMEFIKLFEVIKGTLANTIAHWNAEPGTSTTKNSNYNFTVRFITILGKAQWIPHPLSCCGEIMSVMTPSELSMLLITMWNFVRDFPPIPDSFAVSKSGRPKRIFASPARLSVFIRPMRTIAHAHIVELGALYRAYFEPREPGQ